MATYSVDGQLLPDTYRPRFEIPTCSTKQSMQADPFRWKMVNEAERKPVPTPAAAS